MSAARRRRLIISAVIILISLLLLVFGERISEAIENVTGIPAFSKFPKIFTSKPSDGEVQIHVIDVGQADCILIRSKSANILIDAGTTDSEPYLKAYLDACKVKALDYLICTHPHSDHIGGADMVVDKYDVKAVLMSDTDEDSLFLDMLLDEIDENKVKLINPTVGDTYALGEVGIKILAPLKLSDDGNDMSLVVKLTHGDMDFLFMGDAGKSVEAELLEEYRANELDCEFLKVGHHGSDGSSGMDFLKAVTPEITAISCGEYNEYGHPRGEVLSRLEAAGCNTVLRTDKMGTLVISSNGDTLTVISE